LCQSGEGGKTRAWDDGAVDDATKDTRDTGVAREDWGDLPAPQGPVDRALSQWSGAHAHRVRSTRRTARFVDGGGRIDGFARRGRFAGQPIQR